VKAVLAGNQSDLGNPNSLAAFDTEAIRHVRFKMVRQQIGDMNGLEGLAVLVMVNIYFL
jgi:hypothetical protein